MAEAERKEQTGGWNDSAREAEVSLYLLPSQAAEVREAMGRDALRYSRDDNLHCFDAAKVRDGVSEEAIQGVTARYGQGNEQAVADRAAYVRARQADTEARAVAAREKGENGEVVRLLRPSEATALYVPKSRKEALKAVVEEIGRPGDVDENQQMARWQRDYQVDGVRGRGAWMVHNSIAGDQRLASFRTDEAKQRMSDEMLLASEERKLTARAAEAAADGVEGGKQPVWTKPFTLAHPEKQPEIYQKGMSILAGVASRKDGHKLINRWQRVTINAYNRAKTELENKEALAPSMVADAEARAEALGNPPLTEDQKKAFGPAPLEYLKMYDLKRGMNALQRQNELFKTREAGGQEKPDAGNETPEKGAKPAEGVEASPSEARETPSAEAAANPKPKMPRRGKGPPSTAITDAARKGKELGMVSEQLANTRGS